MRPSDVHSPNRRRRGRKPNVRALGPGEYQLVLTPSKDAQERASAREYANKVRERERAELEAAGAVLRGGRP